MKNTKKAIFNWSTGKDSALALYQVLLEEEFEVVQLFTTFSEKYQRVSMHGVSLALAKLQAESIGIPLMPVFLPEFSSMEVYHEIMSAKMAEIKSIGVSHSIFGDLFLEDIKNYRTQQLEKAGLVGVFPLWKQDTKELLNRFLSLGFRTVITSVNGTYMDKSFAGRIIDASFLQDLPKNVDPCGENGEFHTFTFDGPIYKKPIPIKIGNTIRKTYPNPQNLNEEYEFWFCDIHS